ncbi:transcription termination/antitermination protein NusG [Flavivirga sp. 57AJ16]|uniref:transcription termination/antitermination protein NusG n=1 Tax=Flavivirga sp. 57AJ16 TaxID=3025307 RepID=UPI002366DCC9|nr:UpxY family transcription antiterminator [Flavivirga sp. 57AJ16]MDD7886347.1 UpxY family transcription antiterminator [Flavivirga sp. 57AJ16]
MKSPKFRIGWYVIHTKSNYEKKVYNTLKNNFDVFLPMNKMVKQWSDRKKSVEKPLFKSYLFIHLKSPKDQLFALKTTGVYGYISIEGKPALVTDVEINSIKLFVGEFSNIQLAPFEICIGEKRRINFGPFSGYDCFVIGHKGKEKVIVRIDSLKSCISAELNKSHLAVLSE